MLETRKPVFVLDVANNVLVIGRRYRRVSETSYVSKRLQLADTYFYFVLVKLHLHKTSETEPETDSVFCIQQDMIFICKTNEC